MGYAHARIDLCYGEKKRQIVQLNLIRNRNQRMYLLLLKYLAKEKKIELNYKSSKFSSYVVVVDEVGKDLC